MVGRVLAWLQAPVGGARPTIGLIDMVAERFGRRHRLRRASRRHRARERSHPIRRQRPRVARNDGARSHCRWSSPSPTRRRSSRRRAFASAWSMRRRCRRPARGSCRACAGAGAPASALVVRSGHPREARARSRWRSLRRRSARRVPRRRAARRLRSLAGLTGSVPVICAELAPGERRRLPDLPGWHGPWLIAAGPDGSFERDGETLPSWRVPVPCADERVALWQAATDEAELARHARRGASSPGRAHRRARARRPLPGATGRRRAAHRRRRGARRAQRRQRRSRHAGRAAAGADSRMRRWC